MTLPHANESAPDDHDHAIPTLKPLGDESALLPEDISPAQLAELAEILRAALAQELDRAVDGAVYGRLHIVMEEVTTGIKKQVRTQIEAMLPKLIETVIRQDRARR